MIFIFLALGILILIFIYNEVKIKKKHEAYETTPTYNGLVTVVSKRHENRKIRGDDRPCIQFFVTFKFAGGSLKELQVDRGEFGTLLAGQSYNITYQGKELRQIVNAVD